MNRFYIYMIFTKSLFSNYQCFFVKFFGLIVFSQAVVHQCQVVRESSFNMTRGGGKLEA